MTQERSMAYDGQKDRFEQSVAQLLCFDVQRFIPGLHFPYDWVEEERNVFIYRGGERKEGVFHTSYIEGNVHRNHFLIETSNSQRGISLQNLLRSLARQQGYQEVDPQRRLLERNRRMQRLVYAPFF